MGPFSLESSGSSGYDCGLRSDTREIPDEVQREIVLGHAARNPHGDRRIDRISSDADHGSLRPRLVGPVHNGDASRRASRRRDNLFRHFLTKIFKLA